MAEKRKAEPNSADELLDEEIVYEPKNKRNDLFCMFNCEKNPTQKPLFRDGRLPVGNRSL